MKKITLVSTTGHITSFEIDEDIIQPIKKRLRFEENHCEPFMLEFNNKTIWVNPNNLYFIEIENEG